MEVLEELPKFHNSIIFVSRLHLLHIVLVTIATRHPRLNKLNWK
jgi:hypothetical protein